jgi:hypothetical protein
MSSQLSVSLQHAVDYAVNSSNHLEATAPSCPIPTGALVVLQSPDVVYTYLECHRDGDCLMQ